MGVMLLSNSISVQTNQLLFDFLGSVHDPNLFDTIAHLANSTQATMGMLHTSHFDLP